jgi:hypothetical protein
MVRCLLRDIRLLITGIKLNFSSKDTRIIAHKHPTRHHKNLATSKLMRRYYTCIQKARICFHLQGRSHLPLHRMYGALPPLAELCPYDTHAWLHGFGYLSMFLFRFNHWSRNKNKKFCHEPVAHFPLLPYGPHKNDACVFVTVVTFLQSRRLATIGWIHIKGKGVPVLN